MSFTGRVSTYLAVAAIALIVAVELDVFTPVRMNHSFAVFFVVIATMAAAGVWAVVQWLSDLYLGTRLLLNGRPEHVVEAGLMWDFVAATVAGIGAGVVFAYYVRRQAGTSRVPEEASLTAGVRDRYGIARRHSNGSREVSTGSHRPIAVGIERGNVGIIVNAGVAILVTLLPAILERDYRIPMDAGLTLWISSAAFLHALGTVGFPGSEDHFYAGSGGGTISRTRCRRRSSRPPATRPSARSTSTRRHLVPPRFMFVFILLFVLAFGVFWEVIEFAISGVASLAGTASVLTQYGLDDTLLTSCSTPSAASSSPSGGPHTSLTWSVTSRHC